MGPRGSLRRSASEGLIPSQDDSTPREAASAPGRRARALYAGALAGVSLCAAFLPLADHLGYELAELIALFLVTLAVALWPVASGPQIYAYHHLGGMFPGPIYDEVIQPTRALYLFRFATLLYAAMCAGIALFFGPGRRRRVGLTVAAACG